jgi:hypothetical protein
MEKLCEIGNLDAKIRQTIRLIKHRRGVMMDTPSVNLSVERVQSSPKSFDKIGDSVADVDEYEQKKRKEMDEWAERRDFLVEVIGEIDIEARRESLYGRYVFGINPAEIAYSLDCSTRNECRIHNEALLDFGKLYKLSVIVRHCPSNDLVCP